MRRRSTTRAAPPTRHCGCSPPRKVAHNTASAIIFRSAPPPCGTGSKTNCCDRTENDRMRSIARRSKCLDAEKCKRNHSQQQQAVPETGNLRFAVRSVCVADRYFHDLKAQLGRSENEIEIAEWVEITEIETPRFDSQI